MKKYIDAIKTYEDAEAIKVEGIVKPRTYIVACPNCHNVQKLELLSIESKVGDNCRKCCKGLFVHISGGRVIKVDTKIPW